MVITHKLRPVDFTCKNVTQRVDVMQDDKFSRCLSLPIRANGADVKLQEDVRAVIRFRKPDGTGGNYDTLPDGTSAYTIRGSVITVALAPQVCTVPGLVQMAVCLMRGNAEINTFVILVNVHANPGIDVASQDYTNMRAYVKSFGWPPDKTLRTDADGNVIADDVIGGSATGGYYTPSVDDDGNLTWTSSNPGMPEVDGANIAGKPGKDGADGQDGIGIRSVEQTTTSTEDGGTNVITVTKTDGTSSTFQVKNGSKGSTGPAGADGAPGADGKSAYQYAVDGGYTGTEKEFAAKLAAEIPAIDDTLTHSGQAADSAVVGQKFDSLSEEIVSTAESKVSTHNTGADTHSDIRLLISMLTDRLNALADSDDTTLDQLSEVVAYIKSNRTLIEAITTNKVSVSDIIDNLTTNVSNKPLSAAQGVALKALIDAISIPDKLPNPQALTFTGAVTGSYDGSAPLNVEIPSGGGGSGENWRLVNTVTTTEDVSNIMVTEDSDGNPLSLKKVKVFAKVRGNSAGLSAWCRITVNNLANYFYSDLQNTFASTAGQDYYNKSRVDISIYAGRLMLDLRLASLNNAASKNTLFYINNNGCFENYPDAVDAITSIRMWSSSAGIGAGTEIQIYGVDAG